MYHVFTRTWYEYTNGRNQKDGLTPHPGRKNTVRYVNTIEEARELCESINNGIKGPNPLSRKAEFSRE